MSLGAAPVAVTAARAPLGPIADRARRPKGLARPGTGELSYPRTASKVLAIGGKVTIF